MKTCKALTAMSIVQVLDKYRLITLVSPGQLLGRPSSQAEEKKQANRNTIQCAVQPGGGDTLVVF